MSDVQMPSASALRENAAAPVSGHSAPLAPDDEAVRIANTSDSELLDRLEKEATIAQILLLRAQKSRIQQFNCPGTLAKLWTGMTSAMPVLDGIGSLVIQTQSGRRYLFACEDTPFRRLFHGAARRLPSGKPPDPELLRAVLKEVGRLQLMRCAAIERDARELIIFAPRKLAQILAEATAALDEIARGYRSIVEWGKSVANDKCAGDRADNSLPSTHQERLQDLAQASIPNVQISRAALLWQKCGAELGLDFSDEEPGHIGDLSEFELVRRVWRQTCLTQIWLYEELLSHAGMLLVRDPVNLGKLWSAATASLAALIPVYGLLIWTGQPETESEREERIARALENAKRFRACFLSDEKSPVAESANPDSMSPQPKSA
jgi:hypothetical protein